MSAENKDGLQVKLKNLKAKKERLEKGDVANDAALQRTNKHIAEVEALLGSTSGSAKTTKKKVER
tara:strand:- start:2336 stop:2530 length:195 start_codon:yes stop_codon:yes gene_type:complete